GGIVLQQPEYTLSTVVEEDPENPEAAVAVIPQGFVILNTAVDETLAAEGAARDVIRACNRPVATPNWTYRIVSPPSLPAHNLSSTLLRPTNNSSAARPSHCR